MTRTSRRPFVAVGVVAALLAYVGCYVSRQTGGRPARRSQRSRRRQRGGGGGEDRAGR